jgi:hypothetical protein
MEGQSLRRGGRLKGAREPDLNGDKLATEERLLTDRHQRVRDTRQGPNGEFCLLSGKELLRPQPKNSFMARVPDGNPNCRLLQHFPEFRSRCAIYETELRPHSPTFSWDRGILI